MDNANTVNAVDVLVDPNVGLSPQFLKSTTFYTFIIL
jgi:hypothetical protein